MNQISHIAAEPSLVCPLRGLRPAPGHAQAVVAPPYDVVNEAEARAAAAGRPESFLHISRAEIDLAPGSDPHGDAVYAQALDTFTRWRNEGLLRQDPRPSYYLYTLTMGHHVQHGLVLAASVAAYEDGRIRRHEHTRPDKEADRVRQIDALDAQTGPVFLTYRKSESLEAQLAALRAGPPEVDVLLNGVRHQLWVVDEGAAVAQISEGVASAGTLYIADGHHRSAAAARVAALRREKNAAHRGDETYNYFLAVLFPDHEMQILDYNRVVRDLHGLSREAFLGRLEAECRIVASTHPVKPSARGEFGIYLARQWYRAWLKHGVPAGPVESLDVERLDRHVLKPILGIDDPRRDPRIDFVGGIRGLRALEARVDSGDWAVAFSLFPTALGDLMAVADAGLVMPPKSTWFEPKLADGLVSHLLA